MVLTKIFEEELGIKESEFTEDDKEVLKNTKEFNEISEKIRRLF